MRRATRRGGHIVLTARRQRGDVVISVKDDGIGIPPDLLPRIFEPFTRGERSVERESGGLGLGLALVQRIVELHGGTVHAESEGRGAEFTVRLPAGDSPAENQSVQRTPRPLSRRALAVFARDDARSRAIVAMLRARGGELRVLYDGGAVVEEAEALRPNVVLLHVGFASFEACRGIRERAWGRNTCVIARAVTPRAANDAAMSSDRESALAGDLRSLIERLCG